MRIAFIYPILDCQPVAQVGIASLSTQLTRSGHQVKLIIINEELKYPLNLENIYSDCHKFSPEIIAFSSVNSQYEIVIEIASYLKNKVKVPIIYGGSCPTIMPEKCISNKSIDFVCVGEGEEALLELLERYEKGRDCLAIQNIWAKKNGRIIKNPVRPPIKLDDFYPLDFSVFEKMEEILEFRNGWFDYGLSRGCPFHCSYCQSAFLQNSYDNKYLLQYAPIDRVIENLEKILETYKNIKLFNFNDDTFNLNKKYVFELCERYKNNIFKKYKINFNVECGVDLFDEEVCRKIKEAGVRIVKFGVESGSYRIRKHILKRDMTDKSIIKAFRICEKYDVETWAFNMIGLPTETRLELFKTFKLNGLLRSDNFWLSIYYPIEKTELYNFCVKNKLINHHMLKKLRNYRTDSPLRSDYFKEGELKLIYKISAWIINFYAYPKYKAIFRKLINEAFALQKQGVSDSTIDNFISNNNKQIIEKLIPPFYSQRFKHIAFKIKTKNTN